MISVVVAVCATASVVLLGAAASEAGRGVLDEVERGAPQPPARRPWSVRNRAVLGASLGAAAGAVVGGPAVLVALAVAGGALPFWLQRRRTRRRQDELAEQLIDAVTSIAAALRSGRSLVQSLTVAAAEVGRPLGGILSEAADRAALGAPVDESEPTEQIEVSPEQIQLVAYEALVEDGGPSLPPPSHAPGRLFEHEGDQLEIG